MSLLKVIDLSVSYGKANILKNISFEVSRGERVAIIGRNGAGKTTLSKSLNGLSAISGGEILFNGEEIQNIEVAERSRFIGYAFQNPDDQLFKESVYKELSFGLEINGITGEVKEKRIQKALITTGLYEVKDEHPYNLPYATRKLVSLASTVVMDSEIIILDEPTAGQDILGLRAIESVLSGYPDKTFIVVTHDMEFLNRSLSRVIVLGDGKILLDGDNESIFNNEIILESNDLDRPFIYTL